MNIIAESVRMPEPQERCRDLLGRIVVLTVALQRGDRRYEPGTRFRVEQTWRGTYTLDRVDASNSPINVAEAPAYVIPSIA